MNIYERMCTANRVIYFSQKISCNPFVILRKFDYF